MTDGAVERPVKEPVRRHEQSQVPCGSKRIPQLRQREKVILDMFDYVQTDDRIERIGDDICGRLCGKIEPSYPDVRVGAEQPLQLVAITRHYVGRHHFTPFGAKELCDVAGSRSDFEHAASQRMRNMFVDPMIITVKFGELIERSRQRQTLLCHITSETPWVRAAWERPWLRQYIY